jgi:hypothetical protein
MGGKAHCFTMHRLSPSVVHWRRDDGKTGTARLGSVETAAHTHSG